MNDDSWFETPLSARLVPAAPIAILLVALGLLMAGCQALPTTEAAANLSAAGGTVIDVDFCPIGPEDAPTGYVPCDVDWRTFQNKQAVKVSVDLKTGVATYEASGVDAATVKEISAAVDKVMLENQGQALETLTPAIEDAVKGILGLP